MNEPASAAQEPAEEREQVSFWGSFTRADMRMLVVTIAGTVIGGILLVMVVAVAITYSRHYFRSRGGQLSAEVESTLEWFAGLVALTVLSVVAARRRRRRGDTWDWYGGFAFVLGLAAVVSVLTLLGVAAGIK